MFTRVTGALRAQPLAVSLRPDVPHRLRGFTWPRVAVFFFSADTSALPSRAITLAFARLMLYARPVGSLFVTWAVGPRERQPCVYTDHGRGIPEVASKMPRVALV